jgi:hypothetical protein
MVPAGYLLKRTQRPPGWLDAPNVLDVCSVSDCVNDDLVDIETIWEHNSYGVANDPELLWRLAREGNIDTSDARLFYYEAYELEIESEDWLEEPPLWRPLTPVPSGRIETSLAKVPEAKTLIGYDVVVFEDYLAHSPLSCNSVASSLSVNAYCLFETLARAKQAIEEGHFNHCEPGVYKIYSVYLVG